MKEFKGYYDPIESLIDKIYKAQLEINKKCYNSPSSVVIANYNIVEKLKDLGF